MNQLRSQRAHRRPFFLIGINVENGDLGIWTRERLTLGRTFFLLCTVCLLYDSTPPFHNH
ncbi:hypothetical protein AALP_AAs70578U000100 [Arabis alpina]|uniref:Uncharacterized protein n=1 Tax=Arabis alpina TaxID=50452 RepID=A0A087FWK7_ARAAL|nr:hypothetical protein AALP_AAs70578U000100 [Arabis alpina]